MENRKKKANIIAFAFTLLIVFFIITVGFFWAIGFNSYAKTQYEEKNTKEVNLITDESIEKIENIDTKEIFNNIEIAENENTLSTTNNGNLNKDIAQKADEKKEELLILLNSKYNSIMEEQKEEAFDMLNDLIAQGKEDWEDIVARGENTPIVKGEKVSEYLAMVNVMENNIDQSYETILQKMKEQLEEEGIDSEPVLKKYREEYKIIKEQNRQIMMDKAIDTIKGRKI